MAQLSADPSPTETISEGAQSVGSGQCTTRRGRHAEVAAYPAGDAESSTIRHGGQGDQLIKSRRWCACQMGLRSPVTSRHTLLEDRPVPGEDFGRRRLLQLLCRLTVLRKPLVVETTAHQAIGQPAASEAFKKRTWERDARRGVRQCGVASFFDEILCMRRAAPGRHGNAIINRCCCTWKITVTSWWCLRYGVRQAIVCSVVGLRRRFSLLPAGV